MTEYTYVPFKLREGFRALFAAQAITAIIDAGDGCTVIKINDFAYRVEGSYLDVYKTITEAAL